MTSESGSSDSNPPAKVILALPEESPLRSALEAALSEAGIEVETVFESELSQVLEEDAGVVAVVPRSLLPQDATQADLAGGANQETPGLVVVTESDDPIDRVEMLAAGATRILDGKRPAEELGSVLETVVETELRGGLDGPEVRGNRAQPRLADFLSRSDSMRRFLELADRLADADASLLITGETGVGKERLARALHAEGSRADGPFVSVNCGAIPENLMESQLFGHERGAFTGADKRYAGFFEQARGGTIFLDEVGELPAQVQVKLLTALQRHQVQRLGSESPVDIDVRVMAATHRDLRSAISEGDFREDLYYRLNVVGLEVPPLRERREDLADLTGQLIQYFRDSIEASTVESISPEAMRCLQEHDWPGNVRELVNVIERAMILAEDSSIEPRHLPEELTSGRSSSAGNEGPSDSQETSILPGDWAEHSLKELRDRVTGDLERAYLDATLRAEGGSIQQAAKRAGIGTRSLYDKMRRHGLRKEDYRPS